MNSSMTEAERRGHTIRLAMREFFGNTQDMVDQRVRLQAMFRVPKLVINSATGSLVDVAYEWTNQEARQLDERIAAAINAELGRIGKKYRCIMTI